MRAEPSCQEAQLEIRHTWSRRVLPNEQQGWLRVRRESDGLSLRWDVPLYDDIAPLAPPGRLEGLWNHEVVECFLAVPKTGQYIELEFGPHGHWLALEFSGYRQQRRELAVRDFIWQHGARRWYGSATIAAPSLVSSVRTGNAYLIHGAPSHRCYHAASGDPQSSPDFHRIELFSHLWTRARPNRSA